MRQFKLLYVMKAAMEAQQNIVSFGLQEKHGAFSLPESHFHKIKQILLDADNEFDQIQMPVVRASISRLIACLQTIEVSSDKITNPVMQESVLRLRHQDGVRLRQLFVELRGRITDELETCFFLQLSAEESDLYRQAKPLFGQDVALHFPSVTYDIDEAGRCLALERSTAAAFHSLRCLEAAFAAIWRSLNIPDPVEGYQRNWANRRRRVEEAIEQRWPKKSGRMSEEAKFYDAVLATLISMQNPYRNSTMHLDAKYTQDEARHIFELVKGLMKTVASRMDENGSPF